MRRERNTGTAGENSEIFQGFDARSQQTCR